MFTGIIETIGQIRKIKPDQKNIHLCIHSHFCDEIKVDQSIAHNGVCLTVTQIDLDTNTYWVTAIDETIDKTNLKYAKVEDIVNLERCMRASDRIDGHVVQGHVDTTAVCTSIQEKEGSWEFGFTFSEQASPLLVQKGSIAINGVSLTVVRETADSCAVAIIPYTYGHTNFHTLQAGDYVNIEYDILGKYVQKMISR